jgi:hypothetical protein
MKLYIKGVLLIINPSPSYSCSESTLITTLIRGYSRSQTLSLVFDLALEHLYTGQCVFTMETLSQLAAAAFEMEMHDSHRNDQGERTERQKGLRFIEGTQRAKENRTEERERVQ